MIFPNETVTLLRHRLDADLHAGAITESELFRRALEADPDDFASMSNLLQQAVDARRFAEAEKLGWEMLRAAPVSAYSYFLLATALQGPGDQDLSSECMLLGLEFLRHSPEETEEFNLAEFFPEDLLALTEGLSPADSLRVMINALRRMSGASHKTPRLAPYRHILALRAAGPAPVARDLVDAILADPSRCAPPLRGILKQFAEGDLGHEDIALVERAMSLLAEIGDPATVWDIGGFLNEEMLCEPARWAFWRISSRRPVETFAEIRRRLPAADAVDRFSAVQLVSLLPPMPGQLEALLSVLEDLDDFSREQGRAMLFVGIAGIYMLEGPDSASAAALQQRHPQLLSKKFRKDLQRVRDLRRKNGPVEPLSYDDDIYEICGRGSRFTDVTDDDVPF